MVKSSTPSSASSWRTPCDNDGTTRCRASARWWTMIDRDSILGCQSIDVTMADPESIHNDDAHKDHHGSSVPVVVHHDQPGCLDYLSGLLGEESWRSPRRCCTWPSVPALRGPRRPAASNDPLNNGRRIVAPRLRRLARGSLDGRHRRFPVAVVGTVRTTRWIDVVADRRHRRGADRWDSPRPATATRAQQPSTCRTAITTSRS